MSTGSSSQAEQRSYEVTAHLVAALAGQCAGAPEKVIDLLTGYLWDADEAVRLKEYAAQQASVLVERRK